MRTFFTAIVTSFTVFLLSVPVAQANIDPITRGDFIQMVVEELKIPTTGVRYIDRNKYLRVPQHLLPAVDALSKRNALRVFGSTIAPSRTMTRAQGARIVVELQNVSTSKRLRFRDVTRATMEDRAVQVVVEKKWLLPLMPNYFGADRKLTVADARLMLGKMTGKYLPSDTSIEEPTVVPTATQSITIKIPTSDDRYKLPKEDLLEVVWQLLQEDYLYENDLDETEAGYEMIEALVKAAGDDYTTFMRPQSTTDFQIQITGRVTGIGAQVEDRNGIVTIVAPLPGSPAEQSGLLPNDQIIEVDGESLVELPFRDAVNKIRGSRGTVIRITVRRNNSTMYFNVQREVVRVPDFEVDWQGDIAIVKIMQFGQITKTELRTELQSVLEKNPKGLIYDLRNNPGGLLEAAGSVVGTVVPKGTVYAKIKSRTSTRPNKTIDEQLVDDAIPLVVLVNAGSASASEIVAVALQDIGRAKVVGQKTFGKGTVQQVVEFTDDSSLKMTIAEWLTPNDRKIDGEGVVPDYVVDFTDSRDAVLLKALDLFR